MAWRCCSLAGWEGLIRVGVCGGGGLGFSDSSAPHALGRLGYLVTTSPTYQPFAFLRHIKAGRKGLGALFQGDIKQYPPQQPTGGWACSRCVRRPAVQPCRATSTVWSRAGPLLLIGERGNTTPVSQRTHSDENKGCRGQV